MVTKANKSHGSLHFSVHDVEVKDAPINELEAMMQRYPRWCGSHDKETMALLEELAAGAVKRVRFADKSQVRGAYMSLARGAAQLGFKLQRIPDADDPLVSYIRKRPESGRWSGRNPTAKARGRTEV